MKIAYISTLRSASWGGSEELWHQSAEQASLLGHDLAIFVYDWAEEPRKIVDLRKKGALVYKRRRGRPIMARVLEKIVVKLAGKKPLWLNPYRLLLQYDPDMIIVTDGSTYYTADDPDLSLILLQYFKGKYTIVSQANTDYHLPADRPHAILLFEAAYKVFFVSEHNRQLAFHQLAHRFPNAELIQNPVLLRSFERKPLPSLDGTIHCAVVGRYAISDKGQDILISMLDDDQWRKANIQFHLYGKGNDEAYLRQLITFYGLEDKVTIEGFQEEKSSIWDKCHCLLMCSHTEGTPLSLIEAMVVGRVCIVTRVGGNEEWIEDGQNGFLVDGPTRRLFSAKLKEAIARLDDWEALGKAAHQTAMKKMDPNPGRTLIERICRTA